MQVPFLALVRRAPALFGLMLIGSSGAAGQAVDDVARISTASRIHPERRTGLAHTLRMDVRLVLIPVSVSGAMGEPLQGLPREAFHVFEDGVEQQLSYFASEDMPISLGIVFDASGSMQHKLQRSREAIAELVKTAMPRDEFFLVEFNDSPRVLCNFTTHPEEMQKALTNIQPRGWTSLFDAVYLAMHRMKSAANPRKALLILSDGGDNNSRYTASEIRELVREGDVCIYSLGIFGSGASGRSVRILRNLAEETGGRLYLAEKLSDLPDVMEKLSATLRNQYVLGYASKNGVNDGKYRKVQVRLTQPSGAPPAHASWRIGYYAPAGR